MSDEQNAVVQAASLMEQLSSVVPTGTQKMLAVFNKYSKAYFNVIGISSPEYLNYDNFTYIEVEIDLATQRIEGTSDSFKIVDIATSATKIYETQVNNLCKEKIYKRFQLEVQLDILRTAVAELCEKSGIVNEALLDMNDYIDDVKAANKTIKAAYIANPDFEFITIEQEQAEHEAKLDGGLHELMGPANLVGLGLTLAQ
ncbi:hypothetical protein D3C76_428510 [compost metagenome]